LLTLEGLLHAAGWIGGNKAVVHGLVECGREDALHHADGVGVQTLLDLAGLEGAHVGGTQLAQRDAPKERHQVVAARPLIAGVRACAYLVAGGIVEPALEVDAGGELPRIREEDAPLA
jgi:hypothetical protein